MNFALLGNDPAVLPLISAIASDSRHALTHAALAGELQLDVMHSAPAVRVCGNWDELLLAEDLNAIVVAGHSESVLEGARQLAAAGKPLVILPAADQGLDWVYQLTLVRDDTRVLLVPLFPHHAFPAVRRARELIQNATIGALLHLQFEREQPPAEPFPGSPLLSRDEIERELLPDADLLRTFGGDYDQVTAVYSGTVGPRVSVATFTLAGRGLPEATWTVRASDSTRWSLKITSVRGQLALLSDAADPEPALQLDGEPAGAPAGADKAGDALLDWVERALRGEHIRPNWNDLTRAFEIVDATRRSLARRRTIDLHFETTSERSLFKTQMTAIGCGVLTFTMFAVILLLIAGAVFDPGDRVMRIARALVFVPLFLFLVLQGLLWITRPSVSEADRGSDPTSGPA